MQISTSPVISYLWILKEVHRIFLSLTKEEHLYAMIYEFKANHFEYLCKRDCPDMSYTVSPCPQLITISTRAYLILGIQQHEAIEKALWLQANREHLFRELTQCK